MELLYCNRLTCHRPLDKTVCITICSHIFCEPCAIESLSISLICPACNTVLNEKNEIVLSNLQLSDNQKITMLAGHSPDAIMEIARQKELEELNMQLEHNIQQVIQEANLEIQGIQDKIMFDAKEFEMEKKKNAEIMDQLSEKTRQLKNLQMMYDKLKRKASVEIHQQLIAADSMHHEMRDSYDQLSHSYEPRKNIAGYSSRPNLNQTSSSLSVKGFLKNFKR